MPVLPPPYDREIAKFLESNPGLQTSVQLPAIEPMRAALQTTERPLIDMLAGRAIVVEEHTAPGLAGAPDIAISIFRPRTRRVSGSMYHIHGGGMIFGNRHSGADNSFFDWIEQLGFVVVTPEYRLAPEHPHPAPVEDCYAGLVWMIANAARLNIDASRVVIAGSSAGGGLAAGVALMARDRKGTSLAGQMLLSPMIDDRNDSISSRQFVAGIWNRESNLTGWSALLGADRGSAAVSPYAAPARASHLSDLPPAYIDVGSAEVFRDEDVTYASRIWECGGSAELHVWPGACHGFDYFIPQAQVSQAAFHARDKWLKRILGLAS